MTLFSALPMQHVTLYLLREDVAAAAQVLGALGVFGPQQEDELEALPEAPAAHYQALYVSAQRRLEKILACTGLRPDITLTDPASQAVTTEELERLDEALGEIWSFFSCCEEAERHLAEQSRQVEQLSLALSEYEALDVNLDLLRGGLRFLDLHIGTVSMAQATRLGEAAGLLGYTLSLFKQTDHTAHVALAGPAGAEKDLYAVLKAASFTPLQLPAEFHDRPSRMREELAARRQQITAGQARHHEMVASNTNKYRDAIQAAARTLARAAPHSMLADFLRGQGGLTRVSGWVPSDRVDHLRHALNRDLQARLVMAVRDPRAAERPQVPSAFRYPRWLQPFAMLVRGYGTPRYGEFDPTWPFALSFVIMFGMMFGDVAHGAIIALAGILLPGRWRVITPFLIAAGLASVAFGFLYGSVFGLETLIHPLWMSPLEDPELMLELALYWGIVFILLSALINVRNCLVERRFKDALLSGSGLMGIVLYLGLLNGAYRLFTTGEVGIIGTVWLALPLLVILGDIWRRNPVGLGERLLITLVEGFETVMRYLSNMLSFLRVAAFSLNHVALALAVLMLAEMMDTTGYWITLVLGNLFSLILEGGIVVIQVLRLEYYEGLSRFFSGDGRPFKPITLGKETV